MKSHRELLLPEIVDVSDKFPVRPLVDSGLRRHNGRVVCPVCLGFNFETGWGIPSASVRQKSSGQIFASVEDMRAQDSSAGCHFDQCLECETVFRNLGESFDRLTESVRRDSQSLHNSDWNEALERGAELYRRIQRYIPADAESLLDASQCDRFLCVSARDDKSRNWRRLSAIMVQCEYVDHLLENGIEAYRVNPDFAELKEYFASNSYDFVAAFNAFNTPASPLQAIRVLVPLVRNGGRIAFSIPQYRGEGTNLIRDVVNVYAGAGFARNIGQRFRCKVVDSFEWESQLVVVLERCGERIDLEFDALKDDFELELPFRREIGHCWVVNFAAQGSSLPDWLRTMGDDEINPKRSSVRMFEQLSGHTLELLPAHSPHAQIRTVGSGRFSHWKQDLYFSSSDNTDPNENGRRYFLTSGMTGILGESI